MEPFSWRSGAIEQNGAVNTNKGLDEAFIRKTGRVPTLVSLDKYDKSGEASRNRLPRQYVRHMNSFP